MIPNDFIQTLLARVDIVEVVERYLPLKKAGANFVACCPFHQEKTPSFTVSQTKQFYHCFGCGAHGSAIGFVMQYAGADFVEAVQQLAQNAGLTVPQSVSLTNKPASNRQVELTGLMRQATDYYRRELKKSTRAIDYLKRRGLSGEICARYGVGYAPEGWQNLNAAFDDYRDTRLPELGLVIESEGGKRYDRFRDRVMFPILNSKHEIIGFGGRVLEQGVSETAQSEGKGAPGPHQGEGKGSPGPKYLNSPETPLFEKGRELYGLPQAAPAIREGGTVVVVEGYMDVLALAQHGIEFAVATLGTATTGTHVQKLLRLAERVVFCFDGDAAGHRAAWRALENSLAYLVDGKSVAFLFLPDGHDPDSFVREHGRDVFLERLRAATSLSTYLLDTLTSETDLRTEEGRAALLQKARPLLQHVSAPVLALMLNKRLAELTGLTRSDVERVIGPAAAPHREAASQAPARPNKRRSPSIAYRLISLILAAPDTIRSTTLEVIDNGSDEEKLLGSILKYLRACDQAPSQGQLLEALREAGVDLQPYLAFAAELSTQLNPEQLEIELRDCASGWQRQTQQREIEALTLKARNRGLSAEERQKYQSLLGSRH